MLAWCAAPVRAAPVLQTFRAGDYLDLGYIAALEQTGSPLRAARWDTAVGMPQMISVQAAGRERRVALSYGWRTGRLLLVVQRDGRMRRELAWQAGPALALRVAPAGVLCLAAAGAAEHCYRYVGDAGRFVGRTVLAGDYTDRQGQRYRFGADGRAHFPGFDFRYAVMLEQADDPYDFFRVDGAARFVAFRREGARVMLYAVGAPHGAGFGRPDFSKALAVLTAQ